MKRILSIILFLSLVFTMAVFTGSCSNNTKIEGNPKVEITIKDFGKIVVELYPDDAPITVEHFLKLVKNGDFNNTYIHRYQAGFVLQGGGGCKNTETIKGEFSENGVNNTIKHEKGVLSMARTTDPNSAGSQFFICLDTNESITQSLDGKYAAFGKVIEGWSVIEAIGASITSDKLEYSYNGILMGFLDSKYYITIEKMEVVD